jgi:DedD protein
MGLFSFGSKDGGQRRDARASAGARERTRRERRGERPSGQEMLLDPTLPEKQRARRRLIGALAMVLAAVVVLPMVLDARPKPSGPSDIAIDLPDRRETAPHRTASRAASAAGIDVPPDSDDGMGRDTPPGTATQTGATQAAVPGAGAVPPAPASRARPASPGAGAAPAPRAASAASASRPASVPATTSAGTGAAASRADAGGSRYAVQLGAFSDEQNARALLARLKAANVPAYLERKRNADGTEHTLVRAGPFADRGAAEQAVRRVREAGLVTGANGQ